MNDDTSNGSPSHGASNSTTKNKLNRAPKPVHNTTPIMDPKSTDAKSKDPNNKAPKKEGDRVVLLQQPSARKKQKKRKDSARGKTLCKSGFHKWLPKNDNQFDTKKGKLVTAERCARCGTERNRLT